MFQEARLEPAAISYLRCSRERGVSEQRETPVRNYYAAASATETLFPIVIGTLPMNELGRSFRPDSAFIWVNNRVPSFKVAKLFPGVPQHLVQCPVRKNCAAIDLEETDSDLGILEDRAEELLA